MKSASFTVITDGIDTAVRQARAAAAGKDVIVMGADVARQALRAGVVGKIRLQLVPVLLGGGARLFDDVGARRIAFTATRVFASPSVTHLEYDVQTGA
jgi:dihydrofolate reductase